MAPPRQKSSRPAAAKDVSCDSPAKPQHRLPGDPERKAALARMLRVDQAGEYGARRIYEGQLAVLGKSSVGPLIRKMHEQELAHLQAFDQMLPERKVRPTILQPFWHIAGFALGAGTAMLGEKAAMACTVAVEEVIDQHYAEQVAELQSDYPEEDKLQATVEKFRQEELEHRDIGLEQGAEEAAGYPLLTAVVKSGSKLAIWLSQRV